MRMLEGWKNNAGRDTDAAKEIGYPGRLWQGNRDTGRSWKETRDAGKLQEWK